MADRLEWIVDPRRLMALAGAWDRLADAHPSPFSRHAVLWAWWGAFGAGRRLSVGALWRGEQLVGGLPLYADRHGGLHAIVEPELPAFAPVWLDQRALGELVCGTLSAVSGGLVTLPRVAVEHPLFALLLDSAGCRWLMHVEPAPSAPVLDLAGGFDDYCRRSRSRWLARLEGYGRRMQREHGAEMVAVHPPVDLEQELADGLELEAKGWKGQAGTAILCSEAMSAFYGSVIRAFAARGELRMSRISIDGRTIAFDVAILHARRLYSLKTAYDESLRRLSPGLVLRRMVIQRCFELDLEAYEFVGPAYEWTRSFTADAREHAALRLYRRRPAPVAAYAYRRALRPALKRTLAPALRRFR